MNNKEIGNSFEKDFSEMMSKAGYWVHFMTPSKSGQQPFDIIAVKHGIAFAIDCKTCATKYFSIKRLEDDQITAFEKWISCGNNDPFVACKYKDKVFMIPYTYLKLAEKINLEKIETDGSVYVWQDGI